MSLSWLRRKREPPRVHVQAAFYKVGAEVLKAAHAGASSAEVCVARALLGFA